MTNDEAIYTLKNTAWLGWDKQKEKVTEAVRMAVEALKTQLPKEDITSDCISRQEAIRIASGYCHFTNVAKELEKLPSVQPVDKDINVSCKDAISRQDAIDAVDKLSDKPIGYLESAIDVLVDLPSVQPEPSEMTDEQAILHLQSTGWMQNHDREMYVSGLREQLADDSGGYDSLIPCEDTISRQAAIDALWKALYEYEDRTEKQFQDSDELDVEDWIQHRIFVQNMSDIDRQTIMDLPSAQTERTCVNCGRTANNGGWYADGRTRCPIEEHYALPKDGFCHLWEKRNVTDDDYPERRTDGTEQP